MEFNKNSNLVEYVMCPAKISAEIENKAYEIALIGGETSLILSPDSEFFKFFGNIKPKSE